MTMDLSPFTPDCGHTVTPTPGSIGTGKATDQKTGRTMCYPCAEKAEREALKTADTFGGYLTADRPKVITTWTGAALAEVVSYGVGSRRYTPSGGSYRMQYVRAKSPDGALWYGSASDAFEAITFRRLKVAKGKKN